MAETSVPFPAPAPGPIVAADLEGTCTTGETWRAVARWLGENGRRGRYRRFLVPRLPLVPLARLGIIDVQRFRERWIGDLARLLDGLPESTLTAMAADVVERDLWPQRRQGVIDDLEAAAVGGARVVLASGTYQPIVEQFAARFSHGVVALGTPFEIVDGLATGRLTARAGTGARKAARVASVAQGAVMKVAYGDSAADIPMLEAAERAVAVHPDAALRRAASARGWRILEA